MELWDILTADGAHTGRTMVRGGTALKSGEYHLVVHIWPINDYASILIQKRTKTKRLMPGIWAATGGAAIAGEDSFTAASRELAEELGIASDETSLQFVTRMKRKNSFVDIWTIRANVCVPDLTLQKSEVAQAKWVNAATLKSMVANGEFHNYGNDYFEYVWRCSKQMKTKE